MLLIYYIFIVNQEQVVGAFENLYRVVKHVSNPAECLSVERCVLSHLYDLYISAAPLLKGRLPGAEPFNALYLKIRQTLHANLQPSTMTHGNWNSTYMNDLIMTYRRGCLYILLFLVIKLKVFLTTIFFYR